PLGRIKCAASLLPLACCRHFFGRRGTEVLCKEPERARPRSGVVVGFIAFPAAAVKAVRRVGVKEKLMRFAESGQLGVELVHLIGRRVFVQLAEVALDWTRKICRQRCRRGAAPLLVAAAAVEIYRSFE